MHILETYLSKGFFLLILGWQRESQCIKKQKKFASIDEAIEYCTSRGKLEYHGREGLPVGYLVCSLKIGRKVYYVNIHDDGFLEVVGENWHRE